MCLNWTAVVYPFWHPGEGRQSFPDVFAWFLIRKKAGFLPPGFESTPAGLPCDFGALISLCLSFPSGLYKDSMKTRKPRERRLSLVTAESWWLTVASPPPQKEYMDGVLWHQSMCRPGRAAIAVYYKLSG